MRISVQYLAQLRHAAGVNEEQIELARPCQVRDLLLQVAQRHGDAVKRLLLDSSGAVHPAILIFVNDEQVDLPEIIRDGDRVTFLSPIAGGAGEP
jgi:MoaD family protein